MTPSDQLPENSGGYLQATLFGEPEWVGAKPSRKKRRNSAAPPPPAEPTPEPESTPAPTRPWWKTAKRLTVGMLVGLLRAMRWGQRHKSDFRAAWWIAGVLGTLIAMAVSWWGFTQWQGEVFGYRVRVHKAPPETGWDGELRKEPTEPGKKRP